MPGQSGAVGAGALNTDPGQVAVLADPGQQGAIASASRGESRSPG
jgi:hypothetical protein